MEEQAGMINILREEKHSHDKAIYEVIGGDYIKLGI